MNTDWNPAAKDYAAYRAGYPDWFFQRLTDRYGIDYAGARILDMATGTGALAREFARRGAHVIGLDIASSMIEQARELDRKAGLTVSYQIGKAEETTLPSDAFDLVSAATCWHWFDGTRAAREIKRLLKPGGYALLCFLTWLPVPDSLVERTEALVRVHNPNWPYSGTNGLKPEYLFDLRQAGFDRPSSFSEDYDVFYTPEGWRGRMRASAGIAASLSPSAVDAFDRELASLLEREGVGKHFAVPHRLFTALARK